MMTEVRAADLPEGSIVADSETVFVKRGTLPRRPWESADIYAGDGWIDSLLAEGAQVLRHGYGDV